MDGAGQSQSGGDPGFAFDNSYQRLPDRFFERLAPTPVKDPQLIKVNEALAEMLGLDVAALTSKAGVAMLSGNQVPEGAEPIAMAYAGHQFGGFVPQLGDGRAILLGEVVGRDGLRWDIQLKGSGPTRFSRMGDGRAALGPARPRPAPRLPRRCGRSSRRPPRGSRAPRPRPVRARGQWPCAGERRPGSGPRRSACRRQSGPRPRTVPARRAFGRDARSARGAWSARRPRAATSHRAG